jgi:hypothetical protein
VLDLVEPEPQILDAERVAPDEVPVSEFVDEGFDGEFLPPQRAVAPPDDAVIGGDLNDQEIAPGAVDEGRTFNAAGDCRPWLEAADALRQARPGLVVTVGEEIDPALDGVVEDYDATGFTDRYGYRPSWPLEAGVRATLDTYDAIRRRQ